MPSVRVRRGSSYFSLNEDPGSPQPSPLSLVNRFSPTTPTRTVAPPPRTRPPLQTIKSGEVTTPWPRSNTGLSRVQSRVLRNSARNHRALTYHGWDNDRVADTSASSARYRRLDQPRASAVSLQDYGRAGNSANAAQEQDWDRHHHDDIVEYLDAIDPQVGAVSILTNAANSIVIPPSPLYSRKPTISLPARPPEDGERASTFEDDLDRHVDDVIRRPSPIRRALRGVWAFLKTPMGIITGIYGFLVVFWGAAIVIFLARIINLHDDNLQGFWVEVSSQIENGLFTATSIGLIPFRVVDTYRIYKIWHYKRKTIRLREQAGLPQLFDPDDLPDPLYDDSYVRVLSDEEQQDLHRQQLKFQYHQTWYRAHGSETHRAFPINIALAICFLNDGNSFFQIILCGTMWGLNRFRRPAWTTGILIPATFLCGIAAGILIWRGSERTKRVEEVRQKLREALAEISPSPSIPPPFSPRTQSVQGSGNVNPVDTIDMEVAKSSSEKLTTYNDESMSHGTK